MPTAFEFQRQGQEASMADAMLRQMLAQQAQERMQERQMKAQGAQDDWRKSAFEQELGLRRESLGFSREDAAAARQANADALNKQFEYLGGKDTRDYQLRQQELQDRMATNADERDWRKAQNLYQQDILQENKDKRAKIQQWMSDISAGKIPQGLTDQQRMILQNLASMGAPPDVVQQTFAQILSRPLDTQMRREDTRNAAAEQAGLKLESGQFSGEREKNELLTSAKAGGVIPKVSSRGRMVPVSTVAAQPEFSQAVESIRSTLKSVPDEYRLGGQEGEQTGQIISQSIQSQAQELAKQFGTDPVQLAKLLYQQVVAGDPGKARGFLAGLGRGIAELGTLGFAQSENEAAQEALRKQFGE